jgi:hypothetical protein
MSNVEYIQNNLQNHPFIMKSILKMDDLDNINPKYVEHCVQIIQDSSEKLKRVKLAYNNYHKFIDLYKITLEITEENPVDIGFSSLSKIDKIGFLEINNIEHTIIDDIIAVYPDTFEEGQMIYPKCWCIAKSKKLWKSYNSDTEHVVLYQGDKVYGISHSESKFKCYSKNDMPITYYKFNKEIGHKLPAKNKIKNKIYFRNIKTVYKKELFILLAIFSLSFISWIIAMLIPLQSMFYWYNFHQTIVIIITLIPALNLVRNIAIGENILINMFILFIAMSLGDQMTDIRLNIIKDRVDDLLKVDDSLNDIYQNKIIDNIKNHNIEETYEIKNFLLYGKMPPRSFFENLIIETIKDNNDEKFDSLIKKLGKPSLYYNEAFTYSISSNNRKFIKKILNIYPEISSDHLSELAVTSMKFNNFEFFELFINHDNFQGDDFAHATLTIDQKDQERFYNYFVNNKKYDYTHLLLKAIKNENILLTETIINDQKNKHDKNDNANNNNANLTSALKIKDVNIRDQLVKLVFENTTLDYNDYSDSMIVDAIIFDYDYLIDDFIKNIDKTEDIHFESILQVLTLIKRDDLHNRLQNTEKVKDYLN